MRKIPLFSSLYSRGNRVLERLNNLVMLTNLEREVSGSVKIQPPDFRSYILKCSKQDKYIEHQYVE